VALVLALGVTSGGARLKGGHPAEKNPSYLSQGPDNRTFLQVVRKIRALKTNWTQEQTHSRKKFEKKAFRGPF